MSTSVDGGAGSDRRRPPWRVGRIASWLAVIAGVLLLGAAVTSVVLERRWTAVPPPAVPSIDVFAALFDTRPLRLNTTVMWQKLPHVIPRWQFLIDYTIWRRMNVEDWDGLPEDIRTAALGHMLDRYGSLVSARAKWPAMSAADWDLVPPTIRAMAFVGMVEHWLDVYCVGTSRARPRPSRCPSPGSITGPRR